MVPPIRNYAAIAEHLRGELQPSASREQAMRVAVDAMWEALHDRGVSWVGFYIDQPGEPEDRRLVLGPCRNKPACSPIGMHGVCGQALTSRQVRIVRDVNDLGPNYIACDPRDRSEIVVPLFDKHGSCWGVLDVDSWDIGAFDQGDADGLMMALRAAGLVLPR